MTVGLENPIGANNCFLNVVLQSLWHLADFREKFGRCVLDYETKPCKALCLRLYFKGWDAFTCGSRRFSIHSEPRTFCMKGFVEQGCVLTT